MTHEIPHLTSLDDIEDYPADSLPLIDTGDPTQQVGLNESAAHEADLEIDDVTRIINDLIEAIRGNGPSFLLPLVLEDNLTLGQIAGRAHLDPRTVKGDLDALITQGFVHASQTGEGLVQYRLVPEEIARASS